MYDNLNNYILNLVGMEGSWTNLMIKSTKRILQLVDKPNETEICGIKIDRLVPGRFYIIQYDFNGNLIWCPILALEYKTHKNNHILYGVNLEYLPVRWKSIIFGELFSRINVSLDPKSCINEEPIKSFNFQNIYTLLKSNKLDFAITAYTMKNMENEFKIKKSYILSLRILPQIMTCDFKQYNLTNMIELHKHLEGEPEDKLKKIIEQFKQFIEKYQMDSIAYHKQYASFRDFLKLY